MFCKTCGKELNEKAVICPSCGVPTSDNFSSGLSRGPVAPWNIGIMILWFALTSVIPLVGWIIGGINLKHESRRSASISLIVWGIIAFVINFAIMVS